MKKRLNVFLMSVLSTIFLIPSVLAQAFNPAEITKFIQNTIDYLILFARPLFENIIGDYSTSQFFFIKVLLFILLFIILRLVIDKTPFGEDNEKIGLIISLIISILGIRFINQNGFFEGIFIQYGVLSAAITTLIPMVLFFYFVQNMKLGSYGRKFAWALYAIIMGAIWITQNNKGNIPDEINWIYSAALIAALLFILFDNSIRKYFGMNQFRSFEEKTRDRAYIDLKAELAHYSQLLKDAKISPADFIKIRKDIHKSIKALGKN